MEQTAFEWFLDQIPMRFRNALLTTCAKEIDETKKKEKDQIMEAFDYGDFCIDLPDGTWEQKYKSPEDYYNQKYTISFSYCQREIEGQDVCEEQCDHCKQYYAPLEKK